MLASLSIVVLAIALCGYWFRYACSLALSSKKEPDCIARVAAVNRLSFLVVQTKLRLGEATLDELHELLEEDYHLLQCLLRHAPRQLQSLDQRLLGWDYRLMAWWYRAVARFSPREARRALDERSRIVSFLAQRLGEKAASQAAA